MAEVAAPGPRPMLSAPPSWRGREGLLLALLGVLGGFAFLLFFPRVQPSASLGVSVDRGAALQLTEAFVQERGYDLAAYPRRSVAFFALNRLRAYEREVAASDEAVARLEQHQPWAYWDVRLASADEADHLHVKLGVEGRLFALERVAPDTLAGPRLQQGEARAIARRFLSRTQQIDWAPYKLVNAQTIQRDNRADHVFTWEERTPAAGGARLQISATVQGDRVAAWACDVELPAAFVAAYDRQADRARFFSIAQIILVNLIWVIALVVFVLRFRSSEVSVRNALAVALVFGLFFAGYLFDRVVMQHHGGLGSSGTDDDAFFSYAGLLLGLLFTSMAVFLTWVSGESLARELWPRKLKVFDGLFARYAFFPALGRGVLRGFSLGFLQLGLWFGLMWLLVEGLGARAVMGLEERLAFTSPMPFLRALTFGGHLALLGVAYTVLFTFGLLKRGLGYTLPAALLAILLVDAPLSEMTLLYERWLVYLAAVPVVGLSYVYFLRYDLFTVFVGAFVFTVSPVALAYLYQPNLTYQVSGVIGFGVLGVLFFHGALALRRGRALDEHSVEPAYAHFIAERERLKMELDIARRAQLRMLPRRIPAARGLDIAAFSEPAREVGGDYYDFFPLSDDRLALAVGDVSGKGMPAALYMTMLKGFLQAQADTAVSPARILSHVNRKFYQMAEPNVFVTLLYCVIDLERNLLTFARAGHSPVVIYRPADRSLYLLQPPGLGVGLEAGPIFDKVIREETFTLCSGDTLLLYTDGLVEARNAAHEEFGDERLMALLKARADDSAEAVLDRIRAAYTAFLGRTEPHDDLTCVVVKVR